MKVSAAKIQGKLLSRSSIRLLLSICLIIFIAGAGSIFVINWQMKTHTRQEAREKAMMMLERNLAIHTYFSHQLKPTLFKTMEPLVGDDYFEPVWMSSTYAVRGMDQYYRSISKIDYYYKECAINARSPENEADKFERAFIEKLNGNSGLKEFSGVRVINEKPFFVVLRRGETMEQSCLRCHSTAKAAPADLLAQYGPDRSFDRSIGEVVSAISIRIPLDVAYGKVNRLITHLSVLFGAALLIVFGLAAYLSKRWVFGPLDSVRLNAMEISKNPELLGEQIALPSSYELSELTKAFNTMSLQLRRERDALEKRVEERTKDLKKTHDMLRAVLDAAPAGVMVADVTGRLLLTSAATQSIFGCPVTGNALKPEGGYRISAPDGSSIPHDLSPLPLALAGQTVINRETLITRMDGSPAVVLSNATPLKNDGGEPWGAVAVFQDITERKRAVEVLQESEERFRLLFENMSEGFALHEIITDADGRPSDYRFLEINPAFERLTGLSRETTIGKTVREAIPDIEAYWIETYGRVALEGTPLHMENYSAPLNRWYEVFAYRTAPRQFAAIFTDITDRKQTEDALRANVQRLRWALHGSGGGAWDWDLASGEAWWSQEMYDLWGVEPGTKMMLKNSLALVHEHDWDRLRKSVEESIADRSDFRCEFRIRHAVKGERWMASYGRAMHDEHENARRLLGISLDITERKLAQQVLQQSEERLKRSQEIAHLGSWELDLEKNELAWSDEVYRIFGLQPQQFGATYEAFLDAVHPDDRQKVDDAYSDSLRDGRDNYEVEHRIVRPDGEIRYVHEKCQHQRDGSGRIIRSAGMVHDITEQKLAQEALERSNKELEQFAYVASHDLQEPLRAVVGFLQLLQSQYEEHIDEKGRHYIERSVKAGHRMQTLIRELLTLSRVNTKGATFATANLNQLVKDVLDNLQSIIREKNADITCARLPELTVDAAQIQSLFQNLILNALRYNESPKVTVEIGCRKQDNTYHFFVKDNGIGISPRFYERIFIVFQRLHTDAEYPGTGLGLALCKKIVERHGGRIWVESQPEKGSTFHFTLAGQKGIS